MNIFLLSHGVMVARQILVLQVGVRVPVRQQYSGVAAVVARQAHNLKVGGSIPPSATNIYTIRRPLCINARDRAGWLARRGTYSARKSQVQILLSQQSKLKVTPWRMV